MCFQLNPGNSNTNPDPFNTETQQNLSQTNQAPHPSVPDLMGTQQSSALATGVHQHLQLCHQQQQSHTATLAAGLANAIDPTSLAPKHCIPLPMTNPPPCDDMYPEYIHWRRVWQTPAGLYGHPPLRIPNGPCTKCKSMAQTTKRCTAPTG